MAKKPKLPKEAEINKRSAAGRASSTKGRSRVFKDKTAYDRKTVEPLSEPKPGEA